LEWRVVGASVEGGSHRNGGKPCQDGWDGLVLGGEILLLAVADGAGSASMSEIGSGVAVRAAVKQAATEVTRLIHQERVREAQDHEWQAALESALRAAREAVAREAAERQVSERELASTLIILMATPDMVAAAHVGDGAVVVSDVSRQILTLTRPRHGEYINQTTFIVSPLAVETAQFAVRRAPRQRVAAFTDGLQMLALNLSTGIAHAPFFEPLFRFVAGAEDERLAQQKLGEFLRSARVQERTDDDLTLVLASLEPPAS